MNPYFDQLPLPLLLAAAIALVLLSIEGGYRFGRIRRSRFDDEKEPPVGAIVAATLGLLAFVLAFTFGLAASRFDARRTIVVKEANAIGTTWLRAGLLPDDRRNRVRRLLREYCDTRLAAITDGDVPTALAQASELHTALWDEAEAAGRLAPDSIVVGLFIDALNQTIDVHAERTFAVMQGRIPPVLWGALGTVTVLAMAGVGYFCGLSRSRRSPGVLVLALSFSSILALIADLDRPQDGFIRVSQQAMHDVRTMMQQ